MGTLLSLAKFGTFNKFMQYSISIKENIKLILSLVAALIFILTFHDILRTIVSQWTGDGSAGNSHGPLVLVCTFYLLISKRDQFRKLRAAPEPIGFLLLAVLLILFFLAELTEINTVQMLIALLLVPSLIFLLLGKEHLRVALLPISIMFFAIPIWGSAVPLLQDITTWVTEFNLKVLGRPVYVVGNYINVTGGVFLIEEGCSGLRFLLIGAILSVINSDINSHSFRQGVFFLLVAVSLAFLANWIRVIVIVVLGDMTNMQHRLVGDHGDFGWLVFLFVVLIPFLLLSRNVRQPTRESEVPSPRPPETLRPHLFLIAMFLIVSVTFLRYAHEQFVAEDISQEIELPGVIANWNGNNQVLRSGSWKPGFKNASREIFRSYSKNAEAEVDLFVFHYAQQEQGAEVINVENKIADGTIWSIVPSTESQQRLYGDGNITSVNAAEITNRANERKLVWYWYDVGGYVTSSQYYAKFLQILAQLQGKNYANLIAVSIECELACEERQRYLEEYLSEWQRLEI